MQWSKQYDKIISMENEEVLERPIESEQPPHKKKAGQSTWKYVLNIILVLTISGLAVF